jgi:hypothetical protein
MTPLRNGDEVSTRGCNEFSVVPVMVVTSGLFRARGSCRNGQRGDQGFVIPLCGTPRHGPSIFGGDGVFWCPMTGQTDRRTRNTPAGAMPRRARLRPDRRTGGQFDVARHANRLRSSMSVGSERGSLALVGPHQRATIGRPHPAVPDSGRWSSHMPRRIARRSRHGDGKSQASDGGHRRRAHRSTAVRR